MSHCERSLVRTRPCHMNWEALLHALLTNRSTLLDVTASLLILILVLIGLPAYLIRKRPRTSRETVKLLCKLTQYPTFRVQIMGECMVNVWSRTKNKANPEIIKFEFLTNTHVVVHSARQVSMCCGGKGHTLTFQSQPRDPSESTDVQEELVGSFYNPRGYPITIQPYRSTFQHMRHTCRTFFKGLLSHGASHSCGD
jgi:hypothetical protein